MSGDPVAFLAAMLDEDEAAARFALSVRTEGWYEVAQQAVACTDTLNIDPAYQHIARHDPARALREVEAGRKIIANHSPGAHYAWDENYRACRTCGDTVTVKWPCETFLDRVAIYSDHPDYAEAMS